MTTMPMARNQKPSVSSHFLVVESAIPTSICAVSPEPFSPQRPGTDDQSSIASSHTGRSFSPLGLSPFTGNMTLVPTKLSVLF